MKISNWASLIGILCIVLGAIVIISDNRLVHEVKDEEVILI
jgi:hypothetical protein